MSASVSIRRPAGALAVTLLLAACGGDDKQSAGSTPAADRPAAATGTPTAAAAADPAADQKLADDAQLTLEDLPAGWKIDEQENDNRSNCEAVRSARETAGTRAHSPQFTSEDGTAIVKSAVYLYPDERAASDTLRSLSADETRTCLSDEMTRRFAAAARASGEVEFGDPRASRLPIEPHGDERSAARVMIPMTSEGSEIPGYIDFEFIRAGRGLIVMTYGDVLEAFDDDLRADLTGNVVRSLSAGLT